MRRWPLSSVVILFARAALAGDAGLAPASDAAAPMRAASSNACVETFDPGDRPEVREDVPTKVQNGYALTMRLAIKHKKGETVLADALALQRTGDSARAIEQAGWLLPEVAPRAERRDEGDHAETVLELPLVAASRETARTELVIPAFAVSIARANSSIGIACTREHVVQVVDPLASLPEATPRPNAPPLVQREEWTALRRALSWISSGLLAGLVLAWIAYRIAKRPKVLPPPPPPRPPHEIALTSLAELEASGLLANGEVEPYVDRLSDIFRTYLGARYDAGGIESTTEEIELALRGRDLRGITLPEVLFVLQEADLVKFARASSDHGRCVALLGDVRRIVRTTATTPVRVAPPLGATDAAGAKERAP